MPRYMLDTDTCSYIMRGSVEAVVRRLRQTPIQDVCVSAITKAELLYGAAVSSRPLDNEVAAAAFLRRVVALDFPEAAATSYATVRADLRKRGLMIGANDLIIAAHALFLNLTLVTNNTAEFGRVEGLMLENWARQRR